MADFVDLAEYRAKQEIGGGVSSRDRGPADNRHVNCRCALTPASRPIDARFATLVAAEIANETVSGFTNCLEMRGEPEQATDMARAVVSRLKRRIFDAMSDAHEVGYWAGYRAAENKDDEGPKVS